jgi:UPF0271 protein
VAILGFMRMDLNCDLGEGFGNDLGLLDVVTSANVACGFHAGDAVTMSSVVAAAMSRGVVVGAQVSYADREGFGRRRLDVAPEVLTADVLYQIGALAAYGPVSYVKPHGALYNRIADDEEQAAAVVAALARYDGRLSLLTLPDSAAASAAAAAGVPVVCEGFADRAYTPAGRLLPRCSAGAVITDGAAAAAQAVELACGGRVRSICVHSDTPRAVELAHAVREALESAGVVVAAFA